ncbi:MAG: AAA family ATPase [Verrucomicrobia subdivision 3 bacterium]|nr:AAA family ATPase [Limisphaerales bacterium]
MNAPAMPAALEKEVQQEQLLPFLLNPNSYPHRPRSVRLVQTHASFVFIVPPLVYKMKKAVNFGFLNFSTLERRRHFCAREVELNSRLCPTMYLGVVPISLGAHGYRFGEGEHTIEYAVKMRKLSDRYFLDKIIRRRIVEPAELDKVVATLAEFYRGQHLGPEIIEWGEVERLRISTDENFRQTEEFVGRTLSAAAFQTLRFFTDEFYAHGEPLFHWRVKEGRIRDCHGDLHLEHIHLAPKALNIFDCIEFNDRLRYIDVANDVAFLAMDLDFEHQPGLARHFIEAIVKALNDNGMRQLIDFYKCYRAYVRGKVESLHSIAQAAAESERSVSATRAQRYFRLALQYAVAGSRPLVLAVMGRIGSGKTTLARAAGAELGWEVISSDRVRKELAGFPLFERSSEAARSRLYSESMTGKTYDRLLALADQKVQNGCSVILDATFARRAQREALVNRFGRSGVELRLVETQADDQTVRNRLNAREAKPDEISDARLEDYEMLNSIYEPPTEFPARHCCGVATTIAEPVLHTLKWLARMQVESQCLL